MELFGALGETLGKFHRRVVRWTAHDCRPQEPQGRKGLPGPHWGRTRSQVGSISALPTDLRKGPRLLWSMISFSNTVGPEAT